MIKIPDAPWIGHSQEEWEEMQGYNEYEEREEAIWEEVDRQIDRMKEGRYGQYDD